MGGRYDTPSRRSLSRTHHSSSWGRSTSWIGLPCPGRPSKSPRSIPSRICRSIQVSQLTPKGLRSVTVSSVAAAAYGGGMRRAVWTEDGLAVEDHEPGPLRDGWVRLRVEACGICGSDLHFWHGHLRRPMGTSPGHEMAGTVVDGPAGLPDVATRCHRTSPAAPASTAAPDAPTSVAGLARASGWDVTAGSLSWSTLRSRTSRRSPTVSTR